MVKKICVTENPVEDAQLPSSSWPYPLTEVEVDDGKKEGDGLPDPRLERMKLKMVEDDDRCFFQSRCGAGVLQGPRR